MRLAQVFSNGALFLHSSILDIKGEGTPGAHVTAALLLGGVTVSKGQSTAMPDGSFSVRIATPAPSFDSYTLTVDCGEERTTLEDILFGELWLCSGQSNMELPNSTHEECEQMIDAVLSSKVRVYYVEPVCGTDPYPIEPLRFREGRWAYKDDRATLRQCSALATGFALSLYSSLNKDKEMPIGVISASKGSSPIESWLIKDSYLKNDAVNAYLTRFGKHIDPENWNTRGEDNLHQTSCQYNLQIHPLLGLRLRGMLWYQGETNSALEVRAPLYRELYKELRESYAARFAADGADSFPIISSNIYPWAYCGSGSCNISYINDCFARLCREMPTLYPTVPNCDLSPRWAMTQNNHPIHPTHKYKLGQRMAHLALSVSYGAGGQTVPAYLKSVSRRGGSLYLRFASVGKGLYVKGGRVRGLYIRSEKGVYTSAYAEILGRSLLRVYHPDIPAPRHVCYGASDFEFDLNLYGGEYPVQPFATDLREGDAPLAVQIKSWLDLTLDSRYELDGFTDSCRHCVRQPVFHPSEGCHLCYDADYGRYGRALRITGNGGRLGAYVNSVKYHELDLENYSALSLTVFNCSGLVPELLVDYAECRGVSKRVRIAGKCGDADGLYHCDVHFDLSSLDYGRIVRFELSFGFTEANPLNRSVAIEDIRLTPKE